MLEGSRMVSLRHQVSLISSAYQLCHYCLFDRREYVFIPLTRVHRQCHPVSSIQALPRHGVQLFKALKYWVSVACLHLLVWEIT
jgi:hypothetical protein